MNAIHALHLGNTQTLVIHIPLVGNTKETDTV